ncbi:MAG: TnpV protein [Oscillospiraceae bacterium]|nr:TnpV protein [Oscillospiraceae bacterium]
MKTAVSFFEQNGGTYTRVGDMLLPNLILEETESKPIGKYGRMRKKYLKEHHPAVYSAMLLNGELYRHLSEIDEGCEERMDLLARQMAEREGVTEALKAADQVEWVQRMNSIRCRAEEIVLNELVFPEEVRDANS